METVVKQKQKTVYNERLNRWERQWVDVEKCIMTEEDKIKAASEFFTAYPPKSWRIVITQHV